MRTLLVAASVAALACGSSTATGASDAGSGADAGADGGSGTDGGSDLTAAFVGTWTGTTTIAAGSFGGGNSGPGSVTIARTGPNALGLSGVCGAGAVPAAVTSATTFTVQATNCTPGAQTVGAATCTLQYQVSGGAGTLNSSQLSLSVTGTVVNLDATACPTVASSQPLNFTLVGTKQ